MSSLVQLPRETHVTTESGFLFFFFFFFLFFFGWEREVDASCTVTPKRRVPPESGLSMPVSIIRQDVYGVA